MESRPEPTSPAGTVAKLRTLSQASVLGCVCGVGATLLIAWLWLRIAPVSRADSVAVLWLASAPIAGLVLYLCMMALLRRYAVQRETSPSSVSPPLERTRTRTRASAQRLAAEVHKGVTQLLGLWLFVVVLSGTVAMADEHAAVWLTPTLRDASSTARGADVSMDAVEGASAMQTLRADLGLADSNLLVAEGLESASIWLPSAHRPFYEVYVSVDGDEQQVALDSTGSLLLGSTRSSLAVVAELHTHLLLPSHRVGSGIVAVVSLFWITLAISGVVQRRIAWTGLRERAAKLWTRPLRVGHRMLGWLLLVLGLPTVLSGLWLATLAPTLDLGAWVLYADDRDALERDWFTPPSSADGSETARPALRRDIALGDVHAAMAARVGEGAIPARAMELAIRITDARRYAGEQQARIRRIDLTQAAKSELGPHQHRGAATIAVCVEAEHTPTLSRRDLRWCYAPFEVAAIGDEDNRSAPDRLGSERFRGDSLTLELRSEPMSAAHQIVLAMGTTHFGSVLPAPTIFLWLLVGSGLTVLAGSGLSLAAGADRRRPAETSPAFTGRLLAVCIAAALPVALAVLVVLGLLVADDSPLSPRSHGMLVVLSAWGLSLLGIVALARAAPFAAATVLSSVLLLVGCTLDLALRGVQPHGVDTLMWIRASVVSLALLGILAAGPALLRGLGLRPTLGRTDASVDR